MPPPPVTGAWVGMSEGLDVMTSGEELSLTDAGGLDGGLAISLAGLSEVLALAVPVAEEVAPLAEEVAPLAVGDNTDEEGVLDPEQAESATQTSMVVRPQPTVSLTRCAVHVIAVRVLIEPPHALGNHHFPAADRRNRCRKENVRPAFGRWPRVDRRTPLTKTATTITVSPSCGTNTQWHARRRNIRLVD